MSQKTRILEMLKNHPEGVSCRQFEQTQFGTYHKLASRISDIRKMGYSIIRRESHTESPMDAVYVLLDHNSVKSSDKPCFSPFDNTIEELWPNIEPMAKDPFTEFGGMQ